MFKIVYFIIDKQIPLSSFPTPPQEVSGQISSMENRGSICVWQKNPVVMGGRIREKLCNEKDRIVHLYMNVNYKETQVYTSHMHKSIG